MFVILKIDSKNLKNKSQCSSSTKRDRITSNFSLSEIKLPDDRFKYAEMYWMYELMMDMFSSTQLFRFKRDSYIVLCLSAFLFSNSKNIAKIWKQKLSRSLFFLIATWKQFKMWFYSFYFACSFNLETQKATVPIASNKNSTLLKSYCSVLRSIGGNRASK